MDASDEITSCEDFINLSEVRDRIAYLEAIPGQFARELDEWEEDELAALRELAGDFGEHGRTAYNADYMETYARELADDVIGSEVSYLEPFVDWKGFADSLRMDMGEVKYRGRTFYVKS